LGRIHYVFGWSNKTNEIHFCAPNGSYFTEVQKHYKIGKSKINKTMHFNIWENILEAPDLKSVNLQIAYKQLPFSYFAALFFSDLFFYATSISDFYGVAW
jgi:hypothetical protein